MRGEPEPVAVAPPGLAVTVYPVIAAPPLLDGTVKLTTACPLPPKAVTAVGTPGAIEASVTATEALEAEPVPKELVAVTVKV